MNTVLTVEQVAKELQVSERTVYQYIKDGRLKATNIGTAKRGTWRINREDLDKFLGRG